MQRQSILQSPGMRHKKSNGLGIAPWEPQTITWNRKASSESSAVHPTSSRHSSTRSYKSGPLAPSGRRRRSTTTFLTTGRTHVSLSTTGRGQREKRGLGEAWGARSERSSVGHIGRLEKAQPRGSGFGRNVSKWTTKSVIEMSTGGTGRLVSEAGGKLM